MQPFQPLKPVYILCTLFVLIYSCKKSNTANNGNPGSTNDTAAVTAIGTPMGTPVTKTIGVAGGTIISDDGRAELNIPAGALSSDLAITIQPITNECPNGVGVAYDFLPNGTKFLIPATLTFHYTDDDVDGTDPYFINMAFQDSLNEWEADIFKDVDTVGKTIIFDVSHFTPRALDAMVTMKPKITISALFGKTFTENQQGVFVVSQGVTPAQFEGGPDPDLAYTLPRPKPVSDNLVSSWTLSAGSQNGSLSATKGSTVTYTAPNTILQPKTVILSAVVSIHAASLGRIKQKSKVYSGNEILSVRLHLKPADLSFSIKVIYDDPAISGSEFNQAYHDEATFEVDVKNNVVTIPTDKIQNQEPTVVPISSDDGTYSSTWNPDPIGIINIASGSGFIVPDLLDPSKKDVGINLTHNNAQEPSFTMINISSGVESTSPLTPAKGYPLRFAFIYQDADTVIDPLKGTILAGMQTITITSIHH